ncbi:DoxX family protein [Hoyosella sp. YIM 151337]|uniref:DoxX family protein n=1 Tax=Hoyosella sp. YIM 151337 TaxID=2992742 RepID=UPI002235A909|nr:DoxX family protein [Hoyosella sp. YIM 151337]MCW4353645.1 DoxX family protein [Hoyosella sp. YIM 151337]
MFTEPTRAQRITGWILTGLVGLFLLFDSAIKIFAVESAMEGSESLGWTIEQMPAVGWILLVCLVLYLIPRTALVGAILLTGYLGGAIATHLRVDSPLLSHTLFPIYVAVVIWAGLMLRSSAARRVLSAGTSAAQERSGRVREGTRVS